MMWRLDGWTVRYLPGWLRLAWIKVTNPLFMRDLRRWRGL